MLKRSFAEFHAQRAAPEALEALQKGQERLAQLRARPWPGSFLGTSRADVEAYHGLNRRIEDLSSELQVGAMLDWSKQNPTLCLEKGTCHSSMPPCEPDVSFNGSEVRDLAAQF